LKNREFFKENLDLIFGEAKNNSNAEISKLKLDASLSIEGVLRQGMASKCKCCGNKIVM